MSAMVIAGGVILFLGGLGVGALLALALVSDKISAMNAAAVEAHDIIAAYSGGALRDLADAHSRAETMIGAIEAARSSTSRAESSVTRLMQEIAQSREAFDEVANRRWLSFTPTHLRGAVLPPEA